ncbi:MAG: tetratricopeptide repeat protein [Verrucomicrobia bacterium]|nr:tetratricopeptide repeat protein [Verrucomicrobiota bacterium]MCH8513861.1 tetratricopeptide repeat protein [Kiritimatiellia bacterium]
MQLISRIGFFALCGFVTATVLSAQPSEDQIRLADGLHARGLHEMALEEYERILEEHGEFEGRDTLLYRAGESARQLGRGSTATLYYRQAIAGTERVPAMRARMRLAEMAMRNDEHAAAMAHAQALLEMEPGPSLAASALHTLGASARRAGEADTARNAYKKLIEEYPDDVFAGYAALSLAAMEAPNSENRREWYRAALKNPASRDLEVEALWGLASLEMELGNAREAANLYQRLWRAHPDSARVRGGILHIAWALFQAERHEEALEVAAKTPADRKATHPDTWMYLEAVSLRLTDQEEAAYRKYRELLQEQPDSRFRARAAFDLAVLYAQRGEHEEVLPLANDLMTLPDRRVDAMWLLAESARISGKTDDALRWYQNLSRMQDAPERAADARYQRARLLAESDRPAAIEAFRDFARRLPEDPRAPTALRTAGVLLVEEGQPEQAASIWDQALRDYPDMPGAEEIEYQTALLDMRAGNAEQAIRRLRAYRERTPPPDKMGPAAYWLGVLLDDANRDGAEMALREALTADIPARQIGRIRLRLGHRLQRQGRSLDALEEFMPLLGTEESGLLSDPLLLWMLRQARAGQPDRDREPLNPEQAEPIATAMTREGRGRQLRELGNYTLGELDAARGRDDEAIRHWQAGLELRSDTVDTAEALLGLGSALLRTGQAEAAEPHLVEAAQLASGFERTDLHARALIRLGDSHAAREQWNEAGRVYFSMAVLFDDPEKTPVALSAAIKAFESAGREREAAQARRELSERYPDFSDDTPDQNENDDENSEVNPSTTPSANPPARPESQETPEPL